MHFLAEKDRDENALKSIGSTDEITLYAAR
jgi:hypothetical protein